MKRKIIYIIFLIFYLAIVFGTEPLYREPLYEMSVEYIEKMEQNGFLHYFYFFWSGIVLFGMMSFGIIIVLLNYPINIFFCNISIQLILIFIMCLFKSLYSSSRPFWDIYNKKKDLEDLPNPTECDAEFGNPSGHALLSTYLLFLCYLFFNSDFFNKIKGKKKIIIKYIIIFLSILCIIFIIYSRIYRQIHSFNQIIFGTLLGIAIFFIFCYILEFDKMSPNEFIEKLNKYKYILFPLLIILFGISVTLGLLRHNPKEDQYEKILEKYCGFVKDQMFGKNTTFNSSLIFIIIGGYFGLLFLRCKINKNYAGKENKFYCWNKGNKLENLKVILFTLVLPIAFPSIIAFIPFDFYIIKLLLSILLYCLYGFLAFGLFLYYGCIWFKKENEELLEGLDSSLSKEEKV